MMNINPLRCHGLLSFPSRLQEDWIRGVSESVQSLELTRGIFFLNSPWRNSAKKIACRAGNVLRFRYAAVDEGAPGARPNLLYNQRAVFAHDPTKMLHSRSCSRFTDEFRRTF